jgi:hypothetical protein
MIGRFPRTARLRRTGLPHTVVVAVFFIVSVLAAVSADDRAPRAPGREISLSKDEIRESFLAYLAGLIRADLPATLTREDLVHLFPELSGETSSSFQLMQTVARQRTADPDHASLVFEFASDIHVPVPFGIFGYYPSSINASSRVTLRESRFSSKVYQRKSGAVVELSPFYEYHVIEGFGGMVFDEWLSVLSARLLDDFTVQAAALFTYRGEWHGLIVGVSRRGRIVPWLFNLKRMRLILPMPDGLYDLAMQLIGEGR